MRVKNPISALHRGLVLRAPIEAQLIVTRRCNLSCGYCAEYDDVSKPVELAALEKRIDALHRLKVLNIALLGGEPLLHPQIARIVAYANRAAQVSITTNAFLLTDELVRDLNAAGLSNMQVSIDTLDPDASGYIQKSLKSIAPKLERLRATAAFDVHATVVLCEQSKAQFAAIARELAACGIRVSVNLVHDQRGRVQIGGDDFVALWEEHYRSGAPFSFIERKYGRRLLRGERPAWRCRAGARFLYVDEHGRAQFCSAQMGRLGKPITEYTWEDVRAHARTEKGCERGCSLFCVFKASQVDNAPLALARALVRSLRSGGLSRAGQPGSSGASNRSNSDRVSRVRPANPVRSS
jgi:MoaA/NifB/PqqE/SkfB family radical SAM enzyme